MFSLQPGEGMRCDLPWERRLAQPSPMPQGICVAPAPRDLQTAFASTRRRRPAQPSPTSRRHCRDRCWSSRGRPSHKGPGKNHTSMQFKTGLGKVSRMTRLLCSFYCCLVCCAPAAAVATAALGSLGFPSRGHSFSGPRDSSLQWVARRSRDMSPSARLSRRSWGCLDSGFAATGSAVAIPS